MNVLLVMFGGFFGAIGRYMLGEWIYTEHGFPFGTFCVNIIGCFALGWFFTLMSKKKHITPRMSLFVGTGFIGSFTTFSTFSIETISLVQQGLVVVSILYSVASIIFGLFFTYLGRRWALAHVQEGPSR
jgi:fluoride exporter